MRMNRLLVGLALAALGASAVGCHGSSANRAGGGAKNGPLILTLANGNPGDTDVGEWVQAVERLSHGSIRIDIRGIWRQGQRDAEAAIIRDVQLGRADAGVAPARAWDAVGVRSFDPLLAPFLVSSYELERRVASGAVGAKMLRGVSQIGVIGLALLPGELERPLGVVRNLLGPASYAGANVAVRSELAALSMRALGGRPRLVHGQAELSGFDGAEISLFSLDIDRYYRQAHSVTGNVVLWPRATTIVMNRNAYERLEPGQRAILREAAAAALPAVLHRLRTAELGALESVCRRRFTFLAASATDIDGLRAAVRPLYERLESNPATHLPMRRIEAMKRASSALERVPACPRGRVGLATVSPLEGIWHSSATQGQFVTAHPSPGEAADQNYGDYTLTLQHGRFEFRISRVPGLAGVGRFSVSGDVVTFVPGGSTGQGAGEIWKYRWNLYRGVLVFRRTSTPGPTALIVKPWRRVK